MYKRFDADDKLTSFIGVSLVDETLRKVEATSGRISEPKLVVPSIGWSAFVADLEENLQRLFQEGTAAQKQRTHILSPALKMVDITNRQQAIWRLYSTYGISHT